MLETRKGMKQEKRKWKDGKARGDSRGRKEEVECGEIKCDVRGAVEKDITEKKY